MNMINKMNKWEWMMEYCKNRSVSPAQQWAWEKAEKAYNNRNTFFDEPFCFVYAPYIPRYFSKYCHLFKPEKSPLKGLVSINPNTNQIWIYDGISWREKHNFNRNLRRLGVIR